MDKVLIFRGGCDLTTTNPTLMDIQSCMAARYDAGICKHQKEHTGVMEIWKMEKDVDSVLIRQATKSGAIPCILGGGWRI